MSGREHGHEPPPHHAVPPVASDQPIGTVQQHSDELEVVPGFERENLQGWIPQLATEADIRAVIEKAFDYRGDVTIIRKDNSQVTGYLFDRRIGKTLNDSVVRLILPSGSERPSIPYSEIAGHRLHRTRHRCRKKLRSLGKEILGEARKGREEYLDRAGSAGVSAPSSTMVLLFVSSHVDLSAAVHPRITRKVCISVD